MGNTNTNKKDAALLNIMSFDFSSKSSKTTTKNDMNHIEFIQDYSFQQLQSLFSTNSDLFRFIIWKIRLRKENISNLIYNSKTEISETSKIFENVLEFNNLDETSQSIDILGDGNCFYRSISYFVFKDQNFHQLIRLVIVFIMFDNIEYFQSLLHTNKTEEKIRSLIKSTSILGEFAGELPIQAASILTGRPIISYSLGPKLEFSINKDYRHFGPIRLGYAANHFNLILFNSLDTIVEDRKRPRFLYFEDSKHRNSNFLKY